MGPDLSRDERRRLIGALKDLSLPIAGTLGFEKAEVTSGGVALAEVNPKTLESRLVPGLFFAGEILDLDGLIGGYNFQAAWSTGWLAGRNRREMQLLISERSSHRARTVTPSLSIAHRQGCAILNSVL